MPEKPAKLFLSCGQNPSFDEVQYAQEIACALGPTEGGGLGYDVFFAPNVQTSEPVTRVVFEELRSSDYYVLVDFQRETLYMPGGTTPSGIRGSLFSHQEFAIACFLGIPIAPFQQSGVEEIRGVVGHVMGNSIRFNGKAEAAQIVRQHIAEKLSRNEWTLRSRNQLDLVIAADDPDKIDQWPNNFEVTHRHLNVENLHWRKPATGCYAYLEKMKHRRSGVEVPLYTCELKWEGTSSQGIRIAPGGKRGLDAAVLVRRPFIALLFKPQTDASNHIVRVDSPAELEVTYAVCSHEFDDARQNFLISYDGHLSVQITKI